MECLLDTGAALLTGFLVLLPGADIVTFLLALANDGVNAKTGLALGCIVGIAGHNQLHATSLAAAILTGALLLAITPLGVPAREDDLVVEAHSCNDCAAT